MIEHDYTTPLRRRRQATRFDHSSARIRRESWREEHFLASAQSENKAACHLEQSEQT
jgi:hypothetical protein